MLARRQVERVFGSQQSVSIFRQRFKFYTWWEKPVSINCFTFEYVNRRDELMYGR